jgi:hypothetical protein
MNDNNIRIVAGMIVRAPLDGKMVAAYVTRTDDGEGNLRLNHRTGVYFSAAREDVEIV